MVGGGLSELHPSNDPIPMVVTESGIARLVRELQKRNASSPMLVRELGSVRLVSKLQP